MDQGSVRCAVAACDPLAASDRYLLQVSDFCDAVLTGRQPGFTLEETIRNVGLIQRIYQAAEE